MNNQIQAGTLVRIIRQGRSMKAISLDGEDLTSRIYYGTRKSALENNTALRYTGSKWVKFAMSAFEAEYQAAASIPSAPENIKFPKEQLDAMEFIHTSFKLKPDSLVMRELKWKYLIRSAVRGKNMMMTGMAGCGKTMAAKALVAALDRPDFYFNMGATQDPRATLIGNVQFNPDTGTWLSESLFVKAIQTPNAVILLDELTRAHPDAWNILMPVLDQGQRYLRLDEAADQTTIKVAEGVTFIATANIGNEYTATRQLDKALLDRFAVIEMDILNDEEESGLLEYMFPNVEKNILHDIAGIAHLTRTESLNDSPRIDSGISTRTSVELAGLIYDGFALQEAAEITIYPQYDSSGGVDSERTFVKQIVQKFISDGSDEELFTEEEMTDL